MNVPARKFLDTAEAAPCPAGPRVIAVEHEEIDPKRLRRVARILAAILDNKITPVDAVKP